MEIGAHDAQAKEKNTRLHLRNIFLMAVSWFFYYKTSGLFLLILLFVTLSDWLIAQQIYKVKGQKKMGKWWLALSVVIDLGLLCYFKYSYFFTNVVNDLLGTEFVVFDIFAYIGNGLSESGRFMVDRIILPVGISFYLFQVMSYTIDVYRGQVKPVKNILDFGFYVSFFPGLVAGPIVRANEFIPQLYRPFRLSRRLAGLAVFWILNGLIKKIVLSDYLAVNLIDRVFENPLLFSGFENLFALFAYSLQVYADFSGYTDIAIGIAMPRVISGLSGQKSTNSNTGIIIPPHAPMIGSMAFFIVESSPTRISLLISSPTERKKIETNMSFTPLVICSMRSAWMVPARREPARNAPSSGENPRKFAISTMPKQTPRESIRIHHFAERHS